MGTTPRKRFRRPVFSRLALAWSAFALGCAGLAGYAFFLAEDSAPRVALPVEGRVERFARVEPPPAEQGEDRLAPGAAAPDFAIADDAFGGPDVPYTDGVLSVEPEEVVITIDGAPARPLRGADGVKTASLLKHGVSIPDPDEALLQKTPLGLIPKIGADGRRAAAHYARPDFSDGASPRVAVVVGGLGLNADLTARAIDELPPEITLAFAPYARNLPYWTERARRAGHEIMIELPMEAHGGAANALGPAALLADRPAADNLQRLDWLLSRFGGYFAATNYLGTKFSADADALATVLRRLDQLGIAYLDDTGAAPAIARKGAVGAVDRMILAGDVREAEGGLKALADRARRNGTALGKGYVSEATIDAVRDWAASLEQSPDLALAPASAVLRAQAQRG